MERVLKDTLPNGFGYEWTDLTFQQKSAGNTALLVFPICVMLVFLILVGAVRKLGAAAGGDSHRAHVLVVRHGRRVAQGVG